MISLLHPSRGRAKKSHANAMEWIQKCGTACELIVSIDSSDKEKNDYILEYNSYSKLIINDNQSVVEATNRAAKEAKGDIFVYLAEDSICPDNWGKSIIEETKGKKDWILKTQDGIQDWIITVPIMDRDYYNRFGYIYYPEYKHMFCDTEISCVADLLERKITSNLLFKHEHYPVTNKERDEVSIKADLTWNQGEALFLKRYKNNFGLINTTGKITSQQYLRWLKSKGL